MQSPQGFRPALILANFCFGVEPRSLQPYSDHFEVTTRNQRKLSVNICSDSVHQ